MAIAQPQDAKALFEASGGKSIRIAPTPGTAAQRPGGANAATQPSSHAGLSYRILSLGPDDSAVAVARNRVFRDGERLIIEALANRAGYLTVLNVGPTGNTNVLFNEPVEARQRIRVPGEGALRMVGAPGTERLVLMLSDEPNPVAAGTGSGAPAAATVLAGIDAARGGGGGRVAEDDMASTYAVVSPRDDWKPVPAGDKSIVIKSTAGTHYGVVPARAIERGGILTLEVRLRHQ